MSSTPGESAGPAPSTAADASDWPGSDKFVAVQDMLDRNAVLIKQINDNHSTRTPEALQRNVLLIKELNSNVQKIVDLYQELAEVLNSPLQSEAAATAAAEVAAAAAAAAGGGGGASSALLS